MKRWTQGVSIVAGSLAVTAAVLASAVAWGPHHCKIAFPMVIGCAMGSYESLAGGMFAAGAALFAGWLAWSAVQVQINAEEKRATADRVEVERVLADDIDRFAEALSAMWKILENLDKSETHDRTQIDAVIWGIRKIANEAWLSTSRKMVTALGWDRRRRYEDLFASLEGLRRFCNADDFVIYDALDAVREASVDFELLNPACSTYFEGLWRRSPKAWSLGYAIEVQAGVADQ